jgi:crotonobetainyl-CoA:carnitine CoA-transferase CaiB-like acyl-CoA transferase
MGRTLDGIRVLEVAQWWFEPAAGAALARPDAGAPTLPRPAFGDSIGALTLAGGIAAALLQRERGGAPPRVDVSLPGTAMWVMAPDVVASPVQFDEQALDLAPSPELGQHTEEVLLELGLTWDELGRLEQTGAVP